MDPLAAGDWSGRLVARFGSLAGVLSAGIDEIAAACGDVPAARHIAATREAMLRALEADVLDQPVIATSRALRDYLFARQAHARTEELRALLLDSGNRLLREVMLTRGTVNATAVMPREIIRLCLETGATAVIIAHNHPSGDPTPSAADIAVTRRLAALAHELGIELHDHVIVSRTGLVSLRQQGLI